MLQFMGLQRVGHDRATELNSRNDQRRHRICYIEGNFLGWKPSDSSIGASETPLFKSVHCLDSTFQAKPSIRCFIKPTETLERSLEMNKHKGKRRVQKRPNYKNVGEEEDEEKGPAEDAQEDAEKAKGTEGGSKGIKTSGENEGECTRHRQPALRAVLCLVPRVCPLVGLSLQTPVYLTLHSPHFGDSCGQIRTRPAFICGQPGVRPCPLNPCFCFPSVRREYLLCY